MTRSKCIPQIRKESENSAEYDHRKNRLNMNDPLPRIEGDVTG